MKSDDQIFVQRSLCLTPCKVTSTQKPFSISLAKAIADGAPLIDQSQLGSINCNNDFLVIPGGKNIGNPAIQTDIAFDRYCGERLNALPGNAASTTVCSQFSI